MKIVILHTDFRIYWPARLKALAIFLSKKGDSLDIIEIAGSGSPYSFAKKTVISELSWHVLFPDVKMESLRTKKIAANVLKELDALSPDVLIAGAIAFPSGALAVRWARKHHKRVIIFDDVEVYNNKRNFFTNYVKRFVYNGVDAMLYPASSWISTGKYWGFKTEQLFYALDVVDNTFWQNTPVEKVDIAVPYFIFVGRQIPVKNIFFLLDCYVVYRKTVEHPYGLLLVGDGPESEKTFAYVHQKNIKGVVFKPFMQQKHLVSYMSRAKALILPSVMESWGLVVNEAMSCAIPVIVSNHCGSSKVLVKDGVNGYTFSPLIHENLIERMVEFHSLTDMQQKKMGKASRDIISEWTIGRFVKSVYDAIRYVFSKDERRLSCINKLVINLWSGRYRPI